MNALAHLPIWGLALAIFFLRIVDVSMGTVRTLAIVAGRMRTAMALGFCEVLIWIVVVSHVIARVHESPIVAVAFAAGFASGNAVGIYLEKRMAFGNAVLRIVSMHNGDAVAETLRGLGQVVTTFEGQGRDGPVKLIYASCARKRVRRLIASARAIDPTMFYVVERADSWGYGRDVEAMPTGWRATWKKK
ncbi:MAG: DUF5698 domain-containing protein [Myxococcota bacterium]